MRSSSPSSVRVLAVVIAFATGAYGRPVDARAPAGTSASDQTVLAWPVLVDDAVEPAARAELEAAVRTGLDRATVTSAGVDAARVDDANACADEACTIAIAKAQGLRWVVRPAIRVDDRNFEITASLFDTRDGSTIGTVRATCELCGTAEVAQELSHQIATLARKLERVEPEPAKLDVATDPSGAEIIVDGRVVGRSPRSLRLLPGRHRLVVRKSGFTAIERSFDTVAGVEETLRLELPRARRPLVGAGIGMLVGGLALAGGGAALLAIDGRPYRRRCSGDDVDYAGHCRFGYDTGTAGIVLTSVAVAAVITGIALLAHSRRVARRR